MLKYKRVSGIYQIENLKDFKIYIGSSTNIFSRIENNKISLKNGTHSSESLQKDFDSYGLSFFEFKVILFCEPKERIKYERLLILRYQPFYNTTYKNGTSRTRKKLDELEIYSSEFVINL